MDQRLERTLTQISSMEPPIAVIARPVDFKYFMREIAAEDSGKFINVYDINKARARTFSAVIRVGDFWQLKDHRELYWYVSEHGIRA